MTPVNTGPNRKPGTFVKGDPRINRKGRPRSFDALRKLAQKIAGEQADGEEVTRITLMLREMSRSSQPADRALFLAYAYGKPKDEVELTGKDGGPITTIGVKLVDYRTDIARTESGSGGDNSTPGQDQNPGDGTKVG